MGNAATGAVLDVDVPIYALEHQLKIGRLELFWLHFVAMADVCGEVKVGGRSVGGRGGGWGTRDFKKIIEMNVI